MKVEGQESRIFGSSNWTRWNQDKERKGEGNIVLANTKVCQRYLKVFRIGKLLLSIYSRLCIYSQTVVQYGEEGSEVGVGRKAGEGIQEVKRKIYQRASINSIRLRQKNEDRSRCIRLCNGECPIYQSH